MRGLSFAVAILASHLIRIYGSLFSSSRKVSMENNTDGLAVGKRAFSSIIYAGELFFGGTFPVQAVRARAEDLSPFQINCVFFEPTRQSFGGVGELL